MATKLAVDTGSREATVVRERNGVNEEISSEF